MNKWDTFDLFNTLSQMYGLKPSYKINSNWFASTQYFFIWNHAGGFNLSQDTFSTVHYFNPSVHHMSKRWGMTRFGVRYSYTDNHVTAHRDANTLGFTLDHMYQIKKGMMLGVGYGYRFENTALARYERGVHDFKAKIKAALVMGVDLLGGYRYSLRDYDNNFSSSQDFLLNTAGTFERRDSQHNFSLELRKMLTLKLLFMRNLRANVRWVRQVNDSNFTFREFSSNILSVGLTTQF